MGALSPEERAKLRAVADMIPDLPELRQAQKCKVAISVLFHVLRVWKPIFEKAAPEQYTKVCKWLAVVATGYAARVKRRREVEYALEKMENRLRPYLKKNRAAACAPGFSGLRHAGGGPDPDGRCQSHLPALCPHGRMALCLPDNGHTGDGSDACLPGLR